MTPITSLDRFTNRTKAGLGRIIAAAIVSYLAFGLMTAGTEQFLSPVATSGYTKPLSYFVGDVVAQCLYLVGAGYLCSVIARSSHRPAVLFLTVLGLFVGTFSLVTSWKSEPHWYGTALLLTYAPCIWVGWALEWSDISLMTKASMQSMPPNL